MDIRTTCLGVLALGDASGYEIRKSFEEGPFSHFAEGGFGSIYPALNKMEVEGLVTSRLQEQKKRPAKKIYSITAKGRLVLMDALSKPPRDDRFKSDFLFTMFFADYLDPTDVETIIDQRVKNLTDNIRHMEEYCQDDCTPPTKGAVFVRDFGLAMQSAARDFLENEKHKAVAAALQGADRDESPGDGKTNDKSQAAE